MRTKRLTIFALVLSVLLGLWSTSLAGAESPPPGDGPTLTVHKFHDVNGDGVQQPDQGEEDLQGWLIRLYRWDNDNQSWIVVEQLTDSNGMATFSVLPSVTYKVWEESVECWEPTAPEDISDSLFEGGYYVQRWTVYEDIMVEFGNVYTCAPPPLCETELIAGQHYSAGAVTVSDDGEYLYVTYVTDGWTLGDTHLYVGTTPPTKSSPGQFPYTNGAEYTIPLADIGDGPFYIAAHAVVYQGEQSETAWADSYGTQFGNSWAMYFGYTPGVGCFTP